MPANDLIDRQEFLPLLLYHLLICFILLNNCSVINAAWKFGLSGHCIEMGRKAWQNWPHFRSGCNCVMLMKHSCKNIYISPGCQLCDYNPTTFAGVDINTQMIIFYLISSHLIIYSSTTISKPQSFECRTSDVNNSVHLYSVTSCWYITKVLRNQPIRSQDLRQVTNQRFGNR